MAKKLKHSSLLLFFVFLTTLSANSQKVGLVLSGGGASGIAHIGVIKALEENHIPIDYITGTSMGAFIGALYAAGYTPEQMEQLVTSREFLELASGAVNRKYEYYFKQNISEASWINFHFSLDTSIITSIPTHLVSPLPIDFAILTYFSSASSASHDKFDSLFVPFRCLAADIAEKKPWIFDSGNLGQAVRASISYPFYLKPITINGKMLFDGGLYNNFPADIMQQDFNPDIIIGSNVSGNIQPPSDDNILSEIKNMLMTKTNYALPGKGLIILPDVEAGILSADNPQALIDSGYISTLRQIPALLKLIDRRENDEKLKKKRSDFQRKEHPLIFNKLSFNGVNDNQEKYLKSVLFDDHKEMSLNDMAVAYFKVATDQNIHSIYPMAKYNDSTGYYTLDMSIKREKHFQVGFGGVLSNLPISEGYVGLQYNTFGRQELQLVGNIYFGKLYTSALGSARIYFPKLPFYLEPSITYNSWNYFTSSTDFFADITPPYLIQYEGFGKLDMGFPIGGKSKLILGGSYANINNTYFQELSHKTTDTADITRFGAATGYAKFDYNSLNDKEYASTGMRFTTHAQWIAGTETFYPGTQDINKDTVVKQHNWLQIKASLDYYLVGRGPVRFGIYMEGVYSNTFVNGHALQTYFQNYWSTTLMAPAFQPTPEMQTLFLPKYRAYNYAAAGPKIIIPFKPKIDLRFEGYVFLPYQAIQQNTLNNQAVYGVPLATKEYVGMAALVYHSPIGPVSVSLNYFDSDPLKYSFTVLFHVGFIIFNERSIN
ncbi:MAG TPA: patatin-like phospholipase family protein [Bacteroidia bacterium]|nr:patatin-like phospholipase family protein [Bacteroidia bacterium]